MSPALHHPVHQDAPARWDHPDRLDHPERKASVEDMKK